jgi:hypothetical protein
MIPLILNSVHYYSLEQSRGNGRLRSGVTYGGGQMKRCQFCNAEITDAALACPHCGRDGPLTTPSPHHRSTAVGDFLKTSFGITPETPKAQLMFLAVLFALGTVAGLAKLAGFPPRKNTNTSIPDPVPATASVCAVARSAVGARVRVEGEFGGFAYDTDSRMLSLTTHELCNDRGAGVVFGKLAGKAEKDKLMTRRPPGKRGDDRPGDTVEIEGVVTTIEEGRFTHLEDCVVIR